MAARDPFYIVKAEIQDSIEKLLLAFGQWERAPGNSGEHIRLTKELLNSCESIEWQMDELDKAIAVASKNPAHYGLDEVEIERRKNWTGTARSQVISVRRKIESGKDKVISINGSRQELMGFSANHTDYSQASRSKHHGSEDNDDFISSESDRQLLLMKQQDDELDALSESVQRIGGVGLTIHDELVGQEKIIEELSMDMETTSNRLDFVQKRVAMVMKKTSVKGQIMMIVFLVLLFIILFVLVFLT